jgi:hypothetical protein
VAWLSPSWLFILAKKAWISRARAKPLTRRTCARITRRCREVPLLGRLLHGAVFCLGPFWAWDRFVAAMIVLHEKLNAAPRAATPGEHCYPPARGPSRQFSRKQPSFFVTTKSRLTPRNRYARARTRVRRLVLTRGAESSTSGVKRPEQDSNPKPSVDNVMHRSQPRR